ncbi:YoaK family protein [Sneathia vaginalis]|jgi:hypothetical protein|uniref:YoaK family protein n=1 Tax=Sneathia vaginalis TaxID=187101 RepID=UPI002591457A|nr:YoaK family protein [uncultured Sneathia sp.]
MEPRQVSESIEVSMMLTFVGGFLEIYSFILKGHVFATTITGNIVLMLFNLSNKNYAVLIKYIFPIIGFALGIIISIIVRNKLSGNKLHWRLYVLFIETVLIFLIYILRAKSVMIVDVCLISMLSGIQIQTFTKIKKRMYMSTMCTGNTRKLIQHLAYKDYENAKIFGLIIFSFGTGVVCGGYLIRYLKEVSILLMLIPIWISGFLVHKN